MAFRNYELTNSMIQQEAVLCGRSMGFTIVKAKYDYLVYDDKWGFIIIADDKSYLTEIKSSDLRLSLDDFSRKFIIPGLQKIINSQIQYDDAGQII